jgi:DNA-binding NtrC family response regulator
LHENLLLSELFGHEKGAYTGAASRKHGLFEVADSGTIFLDEIAEVSPAMQVKLLRVLETSTFRRVGGTTNLRVDVRILAATNRDLHELVRAGEFREDLYYRLNVISIVIPPLRERRDDIPLLANHFLQSGVRGARQQREISKEAMALLVGYSWPGNIRELQNVIERAVILSEKREISPADFPANIRGGDDLWSFEDGDSFPSLRDVERRYIAALLKRCKGQRAEVARIMGVSERTLYRKIQRYKLQLEP